MGHRVMYVEDDPDLLHLMSLKLEQEGFEVIRVATGAEALAQIKATKPELVLLDIMLPDIDGVTILSKIASQPETRSLPVIILSNLESRDAKEQIKALGDYKYYVKATADANELVAEIRRQLGS